MQIYLTNALKIVLVNLVFLTAVSASNLPDFTLLAEESSKAVVNIRSSREIKSSNSPRFGGRGFNDPQYDEFFKRFLEILKEGDSNQEVLNLQAQGFLFQKTVIF